MDNYFLSHNNRNKHATIKFQQV